MVSYVFSLWVVTQFRARSVRNIKHPLCECAVFVIQKNHLFVIILDVQGKSEDEAYKIVSEEMRKFLDSSGFQKLSKKSFAKYLPNVDVLTAIFMKHIATFILLPKNASSRKKW